VTGSKPAKPASITATLRARSELCARSVRPPCASQLRRQGGAPAVKVVRQALAARGERSERQLLLGLDHVEQLDRLAVLLLVRLELDEQRHVVGRELQALDAQLDALLAAVDLQLEQQPWTALAPPTAPA
jgi:hypothetical protein